MWTRWMCAVALAMLVGGCASYVTPGRGADLAAVGVSAEARQAQTELGVREIMERKALASFPAAIAVVRIQASGYRSHTCSSYGTGRYSVVTTRDVETDDHYQRLAKLPMVRGCAPINRMLLSQTLNSDLDLRRAAAQVKTDMVLIYTFDTTFSEDDVARPVSVITLGLSPTKNLRVATTASAVLLDTRSGYIYGLAEQTARRNTITNAWMSGDAVDRSRRANEAEAFEKLVGEIEVTWSGILKEHMVAHQ